MSAITPITSVTGTGIYVPGADIDTDRIIPARFMKCVTFDGLGEFAFYDVRFDPETGEKADHVLNDERFSGASILIAGSNFGCGSSREHAPQSLYRYGFRAVIAESFAEIFYGNSITLGLPCATITKETGLALRAAIEANPALELTLDIPGQKILTSDGTEYPAEVAASAVEALTSGRYDPLAELIGNNDAIEQVFGTLGYSA